MFGFIRILFAVLLSPRSARSARRNSARGSATGSSIKLNVTLHLAPNLNVRRGGKNLDSWVSERDVYKVLDDMNDIYEAAGIQWQGKVITHTCVGKGTCGGTVSTSSGTFTPECAKRIIVETDYRASSKNKVLVRNAVYSQLDPAALNPKEFHAWLLPYVGQTSQGRANREEGWGNALTVGLWTDKNGPLRKRALVGGWRTELGSLAKTLAHEFGHQLGLGHGKPSTRLMQSSGTPQKVDFTSSDRSTVRSVATRRRPQLKSNGDSVPKSSRRSQEC